MHTIIKIFIVAVVIGLAPVHAGAESILPPTGVKNKISVRRIAKPTAVSAQRSIVECFSTYITPLAIATGDVDVFYEAWDCAASKAAQFNSVFKELLYEDENVPVVTPPLPIQPEPIIKPILPVPPITPLPILPSTSQEVHYWNQSGLKSGLMSWINSADSNSSAVKELDRICDGV